MITIAKKNSINPTLVAVLIIAGLFLAQDFISSQPASTPGTQTTSEDWQGDYVELAREQLPGYQTQTANTAYYDYDDPTITAIAERIASDAGNSRDAIEQTLEFVFDNVQYVAGEADSKCFEGVAPDILASGFGQCDTQSIVVISILRKMGIAAVPVGGCVSNSNQCLLQAFFLASFEGTGIARTPKFTVLDPGAEDVSLGRSGGGLHAYVVAWTPEEGWLPLEATAGRIADTRCWDYHVELFPNNDNKRGICVTNNVQYAVACRESNIAAMNNHGVGLVTEVSP